MGENANLHIQKQEESLVWQESEETTVTGYYLSVTLDKSDKSESVSSCKVRRWANVLLMSFLAAKNHAFRGITTWGMPAMKGQVKKDSKL